MENAFLQSLKQTEDCRSPFPAGVPGFSELWWQRRCGRVNDTPVITGTEYIQLWIDGVEIGRAELTDWTLSDSYIGISSEVPTKEIWFFEIREDQRGKGYGRFFAQALKSRYPSLPLIAFSMNADDFWSAIGWHHYPRKDNDTLGYNPLFISEAI